MAGACLVVRELPRRALSVAKAVHGAHKGSIEANSTESERLADKAICGTGNADSRLVVEI